MVRALLGPKLPSILIALGACVNTFLDWLPEREILEASRGTGNTAERLDFQQVTATADAGGGNIRGWVEGCGQQALASSIIHMARRIRQLPTATMLAISAGVCVDGIRDGAPNRHIDPDVRSTAELLRGRGVMSSLGSGWRAMKYLGPAEPITVFDTFGAGSTFDGVSSPE